MSKKTKIIELNDNDFKDLCLKMRKKDNKKYIILNDTIFKRGE